ncbi:IS3 family transposase [Wolbachia endosymbiont of Armadillidium arcangelii]|uniref:IS3 family transposase n=1 Tax=Wolbachia endosymbiont of Armadillidium arcangelii TaxID=3158571 RepID=UPI00397C1165
MIMLFQRAFLVHSYSLILHNTLHNTAIFEYIEIFYNKQRRHSTLHSLRPAANQAIKKRKGG